ncbi:MAG: hypothetical protein ACPG19_08920 [Saprospiraceae bacterium]
MIIKDFQERIEVYLMKLEIELLSDDNRKVLDLTGEYFKQFPQNAGVYLLREEGKICFTSETNNLQSKIHELIDTKKHELRRRIGKDKFSHKEDYKEASKNRNYPSWLEKEINRLLVDNFEISILEVKLGRKELEERIKFKYKPRYNLILLPSKNNKISKEKSYSVEEIRKTKPKAYAKWTKKEDDKLLKLDKDGKTSKELAEIFERGQGAITSRLKKLKELNDKINA